MRSVSGCLLAAIILAPAAVAQAYSPPRTPSGKPDFQGVWTNASLTTLERQGNFTELVIPAEQAKQMEQRRAQMVQRQNAPTDPKQGAPTDGNANAGYNSFWLDPGTHYAVVKGEVRSSWIVDPPDGKIPYTKEGRERYVTWINKVRTTFDGPEIRPQGERCITGWGSTNGPPMVNVSYNNNYQIVQTDDHVMILSEMIHDARVIPFGDKPASTFPAWMGNGVASWDGDTLVVTMRNFHPDIKVRPNMNLSYYVGDDATVTERFTRVGEAEIFYAFTVEDPTSFSKPWKGEMTLPPGNGAVYEYACHEGNYAMPGILAGARADDRKGVVTVGGFDTE